VQQLDANDLQSLFDAFNRHDIKAVMAFFADDILFETAAGDGVYGNRIEGHDGVAAAFSQVWAGMPDVQWRDTQHRVFDDLGISEWTFTATRSDGKRIEARGCDLFTLRDGKIVRKQAFRKDRPLL
jgi:taurine dehydrogenase small subunit